MRQKFITGTLAALLALGLLISAAFAAEQYWASAKSEVYHYPDCRYAKSITEIFLIKFASPEEAIKAGFRPCKVCAPPEDSNKAPDS